MSSPQPGPPHGTTPPPPPDAVVLDQVPGIVLHRELGHGGFGTVYLGRDTVIGRDVAVKIDRRALANDSDRRRFAREVTAAGQVSAHPHIVTLLSGGITNANRPYLVMELCPGGSLSGRLANGGPLPPAEVVRVGIAIADALAAAHAVGILHRDVKPANILVTAYGAPALSDFGLASLPAEWNIATMSHLALTPSFAAPETFQSNAAGPQADVFSLGSTLYALLSGRPPRWTASGPPSLGELLAMSQEALPPLDIPQVPGLWEVIARATEPDMSRRTASAAELRDALRQIAREHLPADDAPGAIPAVAAGPVGFAAPGTIGFAAPGKPSTGSAPRGVGPVADAPLPSGPLGTRYFQQPLPPPPSAMPGAPDASRTRRRRVLTAVATACVLALLGVGVWVLPKLTEPTANQADGQTGGQTDGGTDAQPSGDADQAGTGGQADDAPAEPSIDPGTCWGGMVWISDMAPTGREVPCTEDHYWEAFATGVLDPATDHTAASTLATDPVILETCTLTALTEHLGATAPADAEITFLGPTAGAVAAGDRTFVCLSNVGLSTPVAQ